MPVAIMPAAYVDPPAVIAVIRAATMAKLAWVDRSPCDHVRDRELILIFDLLNGGDTSLSVTTAQKAAPSSPSRERHSLRLQHLGHAAGGGPLRRHPGAERGDRHPGQREQRQ